MRNFSDKSCRENQNTHFVFSIPPPKIVPFMRYCGKNIAQRDGLQMTIQRMRSSRWIPKATNTHSEYVTIIAFPLQEWLYACALMLRLTYSDCIVSHTRSVLFCQDTEYRSGVFSRAYGFHLNLHSVNRFF